MPFYYGIGIAFVILVLIYKFSQMRMLLGFLVFFILILLLRTGMFTVNEGSQVVLTQFGEIIGSPYTHPGLYFKIPFIWKTNYFDKRIFSESEYQSGVATKDGYFITLDIVFLWRISDASLFIAQMDNVNSAVVFLRNIVSGDVRQSISAHNLLETVRSKNVKYTPKNVVDDLDSSTHDLLGMDDKIVDGRDKMSDQIQHAANEYSKKFGVEILGVLIRHVKYDSSVEKIIFSRMILERLREAARLRAVGRAEALRIKGEMNKKYQTIIAPANKEALLIKGAAEANATRIQAEAYGKDKGFYSYWRSLRVYSDSLADKSQGVILSTELPFLKWLGNTNTETFSPILQKHSIGTKHLDSSAFFQNPKS